MITIPMASPYIPTRDLRLHVHRSGNTWRVLGGVGQVVE